MPPDAPPVENGFAFCCARVGPTSDETSSAVAFRLVHYSQVLGQGRSVLSTSHVQYSKISLLRVQMTTWQIPDYTTMLLTATTMDIKMD